MIERVVRAWARTCLEYRKTILLVLSDSSRHALAE